MIYFIEAGVRSQTHYCYCKLAIDKMRQEQLTQIRDWLKSQTKTWGKKTVTETQSRNWVCFFAEIRNEIMLMHRVLIRLIPDYFFSRKTLLVKCCSSRHESFELIKILIFTCSQSVYLKRYPERNSSGLKWKLECWVHFRTYHPSIFHSYLCVPNHSNETAR